jgi:hypothetical protein
VKALAIVVLAVFVTGCASTNSEYYEAVQKTAEANAMANKAKFDALSAIASSGDGQAASAAVMALALTQTQNVAPMPQQSQALQWASILATPVTSLGMMWMQADSAKTMARYSADVDLARISADSTTQQALYGSFVDTASAGYNAMGNIDYTPFVDGMVTLGTTGMNGLVDMGDNLLDMGTAGFDANVTLGTAGITGVTTLGTNAIQGLITLDAGNNALYSDVWSTHTDSIESILLEIPDPVLCSATADPVTGATAITCDN